MYYFVIYFFVYIRVGYYQNLKFVIFLFVSKAHSYIEYQNDLKIVHGIQISIHIN